MGTVRYLDKVTPRNAVALFGKRARLKNNTYIHMCELQANNVDAFGMLGSHVTLAFEGAFEGARRRNPPNPCIMHQWN